MAGVSVLKRDAGFLLRSNKSVYLPMRREQPFSIAAGW
jgi:hypothetical protein